MLVKSSGVKTQMTFLLLMVHPDIGTRPGFQKKHYRLDIGQRNTSEGWGEQRLHIHITMWFSQFQQAIVVAGC